MKICITQLSFVLLIAVTKNGVTQEPPQETPSYAAMTQAQYEVAKKKFEADQRSAIKRCEKLKSKEKTVCRQELDEKEKAGREELNALKPSN